MRDFLTGFELSTEEIGRIFAIAKDLKDKHTSGLREPLLPGRVLALLFDKPSLRTRVSFETAMAHLGGSALFLGPDVGWGKREAAARSGDGATGGDDGEDLRAVLRAERVRIEVEKRAIEAHRPCPHFTSHGCCLPNCSKGW